LAHNVAVVASFTAGLNLFIKNAVYVLMYVDWVMSHSD